ncbi:hypothetical protein OsccyDRAFT_2578 [Leptolyngbyaceae cyanobacterium JSC-12]|nr:hypothetical protein OsccyDRAFT_2578 [Leptolyngbyaceae cyanobacterium JSC-12]
MARKRLSDLLREEAQKPADPTSEAVATSSDEAVENGEDAIALAELHEALKKAQHHENELEQQVLSLKTDLKAQTTTAKKLQTQLQTVEQRNHQLETELAEVKQTALQLADVNSQLKQELEALKLAQKPKTSEATTKPMAASIKPAKSAPSLATKPLTQQEVLRRQADSLAHPIFPAAEKTPGQFSEQDLGWVD